MPGLAKRSKKGGDVFCGLRKIFGLIINCKVVIFYV